MTKIETLNKAYVTKLEETNSHDEAILHVAWLAYQDGIKSMGGEVAESYDRYFEKSERSQFQGLFDDMLGNPMNELNKLNIKDDGWIEWNGGEMPVDGDAKVLYVMRSEKDHDAVDDLPCKAKNLCWNWNEKHYDIVAYKVIE